MKKLYFSLFIAMLTFSLNTVCGNDALQSLQTSIDRFEKESNSSKSKLIYSAIKMNIRYLESSSKKKIATAERRLVRYQEELKQDPGNIQRTLERIKINEEKIKTEHEFQCALDQLKSALHICD